MLTNLSSNRMFQRFFSSISWWTLNVAAAPTIQKVINEVNNNNRNENIMKFVLINYFRVICACQHCQTRTKRETKKSKFDFRFLVECGRTAISASAEKDILATIYLFIFISKKCDAILVWMWRRSLALYMCIHFQWTNSLIFISIKCIRRVCQFPKTKKQSHDEQTHISICARRLSVFRSHHYSLNGCWRLDRTTENFIFLKVIRSVSVCIWINFEKK